MDINITTEDRDLGTRVGEGRRSVNDRRRKDNKDKSRQECSLKDDITGAIAEVAFMRMMGITPEYNKMVLSAVEWAKKKHEIADVTGPTGIQYEVKSIDKPWLNLVVNQEGHKKDKHDRIFVLIHVDIDSSKARAMGWTTGKDVLKAQLITSYQSPHYRVNKENLRAMKELPDGR